LAALTRNHASDGDDGPGKRAWARVAGRSKQWINRGKSGEMKRAAAAAHSRERASPSRAAGRDRFTVLNLSDLGACLKVESPIGIPDSFDFVLDHAPVRSCRVTWRKATQIGVTFALD